MEECIVRVQNCQALLFPFYFSRFSPVHPLCLWLCFQQCLFFFADPNKDIFSKIVLLFSSIVFLSPACFSSLLNCHSFLEILYICFLFQRRVFSLISWIPWGNICSLFLIFCDIVCPVFICSLAIWCAMFCCNFFLEYL